MRDTPYIHWTYEQLPPKEKTRVDHAVAAVLQALLDDAFPDEDSDYHYGCEQLLDGVRDSIPVLRPAREDPED